MLGGCSALEMRLYKAPRLGVEGHWTDIPSSGWRQPAPMVWLLPCNAADPSCWIVACCFISPCLSFPLCKTPTGERQDSPRIPIEALRVQLHPSLSQSKPELLPSPAQDVDMAKSGVGVCHEYVLAQTASPQGHMNVNLKAERRAPIRDREEGSSTGLGGFTQPQKSLAQQPARSVPVTGTSVLSSWQHSFA